MPEKFVDPFEEFRKQKKSENAAKKDSKGVTEFEVKDETKPKGFLTHRHNFGSSVPPRIEVEKPGKFQGHRHKTTAQTNPEKMEKPKGFTIDRLKK